MIFAGTSLVTFVLCALSAKAEYFYPVDASSVTQVSFYLEHSGARQVSDLLRGFAITSPCRGPSLGVVQCHTIQLSYKGIAPFVVSVWPGCDDDSTTDHPMYVCNLSPIDSDQIVTFVRTLRLLYCDSLESSTTPTLRLSYGR
jgi:hypothetical protein